MNTRAHVLISGKVQGVFFRSSLREQAFELCVKGWVRNLPNEQVEAVFEGEENALKKLIEFCKHGPPRAKVSNVEVTWETYTGEFIHFGLG